MAILSKRKPFLCAAMILAATAVSAWAEFPINTLVTFDGTNGAYPEADLTLSPDGTTLYGTTSGDRNTINRPGTVFSVGVNGIGLTILGLFNARDGLKGGLTLSGNKLYGTTYAGGQFGYGTVYSVTLPKFGATTLASFYPPVNGAHPKGNLTISGNALYGTTEGGEGGASNFGTVYSIQITAGPPPMATVAFSGTNGATPSAGLTLSADGTTLYGTTRYGGIGFNGALGSGYGTVFSVPVTGGTPTIVTSFDGTNGRNPVAGLTLSRDGTTLYGTAPSGGASGFGTVFSVPITGGTATVLASFDGINGRTPKAGLALSADGNTLYGTTSLGGAYHGDPYSGTVFSIPITGGTPTVLASFDWYTTGGDLEAGVTLSPDGNTLYGTTFQPKYGGGDGTVFSITIPEPASLAVLAMVVPALLMRRRR
jgi:uncharacterized repeat protein (TIGR03803 family)